jgi:hypothetical protein
MDQNKSLTCIEEIGQLEPAFAISGTSRQKFPTRITSPHIRAYLGAGMAA